MDSLVYYSLSLVLQYAWKRILDKFTGGNI